MSEAKCVACCDRLRGLNSLPRLQTGCHDVMLHYPEIRELASKGQTDLCPKVILVFRLQDLLNFMRSNLPLGATIAETCCDWVQHADGEPAHAVGDIHLVQKQYLNLDFFIQNMRLDQNLDLEPIQDLLIHNAIFTADRRLCEFLLQWRPELRSALRVETGQTVFMSQYDPRVNCEQIVKFGLEMGLLARRDAFLIALAMNMDYMAYLHPDLDVAQSDICHDIVSAISYGEEKSNADVEVMLQELGQQGVGEIGVDMLSPPDSAFVHMMTCVKTSTIRRCILKQVITTLTADAAANPDLYRAFVRGFVSDPEADWCFVPMSMARSCLADLVAYHDSEAFGLYLDCFALYEDYAEVLLQTFDKDSGCAMHLVRDRNLAITPELRAECARIFQYQTTMSEFDAEYLDFLQNELGVDIQMAWYAQALAANRISFATVLAEMQRRRYDTDWNQPVARNQISALNYPLSHAVVPDLRIIEIIFYLYSSTVEVEKLAQDLNLDLDYDRLCGIFWSAVPSTNHDCSLGHEMCRFVNMASAYHGIYAVIRQLHLMQPMDRLMAEIWQAVSTIYPASSVVRNHYQPYHRTQEIVPDYRETRQLKAWCVVSISAMRRNRNIEI